MHDQTASGAGLKTNLTGISLLTNTARSLDGRVRTPSISWGQLLGGFRFPSSRSFVCQEYPSMTAHSTPQCASTLNEARLPTGKDSRGAVFASGVLDSEEAQPTATVVSATRRAAAQGRVCTL